MNNDLISREALKEVINDLFRSGEYDCNSVLKAIDNAPTVEPDLEFAKWVTNMIFDNQVKDFDFEMFSELACRKLEKMGLVKKTESEWIKKGGAE